MIVLKRTNATSEDFVKLVKILDNYLAVTDGEDHAFYDQYNRLTEIKYVVLAYEGQEAVACGAIKQFEKDYMEVKRMFTLVSHRGRSIAGQVLTELEVWARDLGNSHCVLETGKRQVEAISFYQKMGYQKRSNYGQYIGVENSQCFIKKLD